MNYNTQAMISTTELNNFSKLSKIIEKFGEAIVTKNEKPIYIISQIAEDTVDNVEVVSDEELFKSSDKFLKRNAEVYKRLAK